MATMKAKYLGQLRVECEHVAKRYEDDDRRSGR